LPRAVTPAAPVTIRLFEDNNKTIYVASGTGTTYRVDKISYNPITKTETIAQSWTGFNGPILAMAVLPDSGDILAVGGNFTAPFSLTLPGYKPVVLRPLSLPLMLPLIQSIWNRPGMCGSVATITTTGTRLGVWTQAGTFNTGLTASARVRAIVAGPKTGQAYIGGEFFTIGPGSTSAEKVGLVDFLARVAHRLIPMLMVVCLAVLFTPWLYLQTALFTWPALSPRTITRLPVAAPY
jgi:hypothetical protein